MTEFLRLIEVPVERKGEALRRAVKAILEDHEPPIPVFTAAPEAFSALPRAPFAYWVTDLIRRLFADSEPLEASGRDVCSGATTNDDQRFLRLWFEVDPRRLACNRAESSAHRWCVLAKGGEHSRFFADPMLIINWAEDGREAKAHISEYRGSRGWGYQWSAALNGYVNFFRAGLTWSRRSQRGLSLRALPSGCLFGDKGPAVFAPNDEPSELLFLLAVTNSQPFRDLVATQMAFGSYEVGVLERTPLPSVTEPERTALAELARKSWSVKRALEESNEASHVFLLPAGLREQVTGMRFSAIELELEALQHAIDEACFRAYGFSPEDRSAVELWAENALDADDEASADDPGDEMPEVGIPAVADYSLIVSWLVGVSFGRFDPLLATAERAIPPEPEPFEPLPSRSPGMYPEGEDPADRPDILVDDEGHTYDLAARAQAVSDRVNIDLPDNIRGWLAKEFLPLHIKMYSKSRRKAPIYWQLATPSAAYSVWLYIHAFGKDTLFRVQNDYVAPKLVHEERRLESLTNGLRDGGTAAQRKQLAAQEGLVEELRAFLDEVKRVAPLWNPNLFDGVIINFAPLWRLVPQNKAWQRELKSTWDALCAGQYNWAHLAMHLWPERVVPDCAKDRSLAIAHGLEDVFWVEGTDGKWTARKTPTRSVDELVRERTSPAVKSALKSLLEAPAAAGKSGGRRGGGRRKGATAAEGGDA